MADAFRQISGISLITPRGAFYAFPNMARLQPNSEEMTTTLLRQAGVAVVPGKAFGEFGEGCIRIAFSCALPHVRRGMDAIKDYCDQASLASR